MAGELDLDERIRGLCDGLQGRLDAELDRRIASTGTSDAA
jgi:hypothetical protein